MPPAQKRLNVLLLNARRPPRPGTTADLWRAWRAAVEEEAEAFRAWCRREGAYERFLAALDREESAARALSARVGTGHSEAGGEKR